jgi:uracil-DNA glycosylase
MRVYESGLPFDDRSGDRLREWLGLTSDVFYDPNLVAILPMAFCFPGYDAKGADLAPPKRCAATWRSDLIAQFADVRLTVLVGGYAQKWHLGVKTGVTETVFKWRSYAPDKFVLPHPSWRNTGWLRKNPWFEIDVLPALQAQVKEVIG